MDPDPAAAGVVDLAIVIEEEGGIEKPLVHVDRFGPVAGRVARGDIKVAAILHAIGGDHVEDALVVSQRGGIDLHMAGRSVREELARPG